MHLLTQLVFMIQIKIMFVLFFQKTFIFNFKNNTKHDYSTVRVKIFKFSTFVFIYLLIINISYKSNEYNEILNLKT